MKNGILSYHTPGRVFLFLLLVLICVQSVKGQCPASSPLVIDAINSTESRCLASGTATVSVSGGSTPYTYSIIAGPATAAAQSSNVLQSLAPGTYTLRVTDNCNTSVTGNFTISGTYTIPAPTFTTQSPSCPGSSDGSLTVSVANGRAPLTYSLISPSPVIVGPQTSNVFSGLPVGNYTCQVTDSCGNFQTRTINLPAGNAGAVNYIYDLNYLACDSFAYTIYIIVADSADYKPPFTTSITLPDGTVMTHVLTKPAASAGLITDTYRYRYHHQAGVLDPLVTRVTNNCGVSQSITLPLLIILDMQISFLPPSGCNTSYTYTFDAGNDNSTSPSQLHCGTLTYTLVSPSGVALATQTNNSTFSGYPVGNGYKVIRQDCCEKDTLTFDWQAPVASMQIGGYQLYPARTCKEGTTGLWIYFNFVFTTGYLVVESGSPSVTFADGTVHTYTYPDTLQNQNFNIGGIVITDLTTGTYKIVAVDVCGHRDSTMVTINPSDLRHDAFTAAAVKGCVNANQIQLKASSNATNFSTYADITVNSSTVASVSNSPYAGSVTGLSSGTYVAAYNYQNSFVVKFLQGMDSYGCDVIKDTLVIPVYTQPVFAASPAVANCGSVRDVALLPDSSSGISPYQYQIISGPTTTSVQSSPVFPGLSAGTYIFQMADACANSYSRSITIDTLAVPNMSINGGTCAGGAATFTLPASPFYDYTWLHPNGATTSGDTLSFNPITNVDTGTYTISLTSTVGGCTSTSSRNFILSYCMVLSEDWVDLSGQQKGGDIQLSWKTTGEPTTGYFIVGRSTDGITYTPVQQVDVAGEESHIYTTTDRNVPAGPVYYRLQMVDKYGASHYSKTISFNIDHQQTVNVYPRWITGNAAVKCVYPATNGNAFFRVIGVDGRIWRTVPLAAGTTQTMIDVAGLPAGNYFIVFTTKDSVVPTQVWKE